MWGLAQRHRVGLQPRQLRRRLVVLGVLGRARWMWRGLLGWLLVLLWLHRVARYRVWVVWLGRQQRRLVLLARRLQRGLVRLQGLLCWHEEAVWRMR